LASTGWPVASTVPRSEKKAWGKLLPSSWLQKVIVTAACAGHAHPIHSKKENAIRIGLVMTPLIA